MKDEKKIVFTETSEGARTYDLMPTYSHEGIRYLYDVLFQNTPQIIADIGSGTGKLTAQLMQNNNLYGVEPDSNMRMVAEEKFKGFRNFSSVDGTAENTNLPDHSIDYFTVGQAFHRFDSVCFRKEADRVLKNNDNVIIIWNRIYYDRPIFKDLLLAIKASYSGYTCRFECRDEVQGAIMEIQQNDRIAFEFFHGRTQKKTFLNPFELTEEEFKAICLSLWIFPLANGQETQKILSSSVFNLPLFEKEISKIYARYNKNGKIVLPLETDIYHSKEDK